MRRTLLAFWTLTVFAAGFVVGRYEVGESRVQRSGSAPADSNPQAKGDRPGEGAVLRPGPPGTLAGQLPASGPRAPRRSLGTPGAAPADAPESGLPAWMTSPEAQADLLAQRQEALRAQAIQLDEMIRSLQEGGAPQSEIDHFRGLRALVAEEAAEEVAPPEASPPERGEAELRAELGASLEESGMPADEVAAMVEELEASGAAMEPAGLEVPEEARPPHERRR